MLRVQVHTLQVQVQRLHDELREARIARDHAEEAARTERARYVQMLQEFYQRYDRLLDAPRAPLPPGTSQMPLGASQASRRPARLPGHQDRPQRGAMRRRIVALLQDHPEGLTPAEMRTLLGVNKSLADTCLGMLRYGLLQRVEHGRYFAP
jgi:hypothetical protein